MSKCVPAALLALVLALPASAVLAQQFAPAPERATGRTARDLGVATRHMVAAANPLAADAGREILRAGGSAVDAAIAVQLVLGLVEPQSSGLGGGAFLLHWHAGTRSLTSLDGRETAPAAATPDLFLRPDGQPMPFREAMIGGRSVGTPGLVRLLETAHRRHGRLPWARLFEPAIRHAEEGFRISPRLSGLLSNDPLANDPLAREVYYRPDGSAKPAGELLRLPAYAATLRRLAADGAQAFYAGEIAEEIVAKVAGHPTTPGRLTLADLAAYRVAERAPVCGAYRGFRVCGMGPPSSGAIAVQQMLGLVERFDLARMGPGPDAAHVIAEAGRLAFADRNLYVADADFVPVPVAGLIDPAYLATRSALIGERAMGTARPGEPPGRRADLLSPSLPTDTGTSHISIVDADGNAVSMTTTIEAGFGARLMTRHGFLLNNQLTDFNFAPMADGRPVANRVEPGKRPRSSMAPTIVFDAHGRLHAVVGSPGGSLIIGYVAKALIAMIDWRMDPQRAADMGNFGSRNGPTELERGSEVAEWQAALEARGHRVALIETVSGIQAIMVTPRGYDGGADSRREGVAIGD